MNVIASMALKLIPENLKSQPVFLCIDDIVVSKFGNCRPLGYRMWQKKESKLELAAFMVHQVMPEFSKKKNVIILCDSWYIKKGLVCIVDEYKNLVLPLLSYGALKDHFWASVFFRSQGLSLYIICCTRESLIFIINLPIFNSFNFLQ